MTISHRPAPEVAADITDGVHAFYAFVDDGEASRTADLFMADATLTFGPGSPHPGTIEGAAIADAMAARERLTTAFTRHVVSNLILRVSGVGVSARYLLTLYRSDDEHRPSTPAFVADVREVWSQSMAGWKIASRIITPAFFRG